MTKDQSPADMLSCRHSRRCDEQQSCNGKRCERKLGRSKLVYDKATRTIVVSNRMTDNKDPLAEEGVRVETDPSFSIQREARTESRPFEPGNADAMGRINQSLLLGSDAPLSPKSAGHPTELERELTAALRWALPLADRALEDHRVTRLLARHFGIGAGTDCIGLWPEEQNKVRDARVVLSKATKRGL